MSALKFNGKTFSLECTYVGPAQKRAPPKGYIEGLEARVEKLEKLFPDGDVMKELNAAVDIDAWLLQRFPHSLAESSDNRSGHTCDVTHAASVIRNVQNQPAEVLQDDDSYHLLLADDMKRLSLLGNGREHTRFFGKSSDAMLVQAAIALKSEYAGGDDTRRRILGSIREEFWIPLPWERDRDVVPKASFVFPQDDLMASLVDLYFTKINLMLPLLHRPSFERSIAEGLHLQNDGFGANLLLVCAIASRFSDDPRVLLDGYDSLHSSGWKWYLQVDQINKHKSVLAPPTLYDLQLCCGADHNGSDAEFSIGPTVFDVDFPAECDDEYWEHPDPSKRFKQPPNKPSYVTAFVLLLKLHQVLILILRTVYSISRTKMKYGLVGRQWEQKIVAELDSALNKWLDSVPDHRAPPSLFSTMIFTNKHLVKFGGILQGRISDSSTNQQHSIAHIIISRSSFINLSYRHRARLLPLPSHPSLSAPMPLDHAATSSTPTAVAGSSLCLKYKDIMYELASMGDLPLPSSSPASNKRDRDADESPASSSAQTSNSPSSAGADSTAPRMIAGSQRVQSHAQLVHPSPQVNQQASCPLPLYSNELGRYPIHTQQPEVPTQSGASQQELPQAFWDTLGSPSGDATTSTSADSYSQTAPAVTFPFPMDLFSSYLAESGFDGSFVQPQAAYDTGNLGGGAVPAQPPHTVTHMGSGNGLYDGSATLNPSQTPLDNDTVAMWSNAPSGFEYVELFQVQLFV
ncbi:hypothetical protein DXG03_006928 [Asterophora parasitica]|uniref:Uncharacterized protein n=1 Tax=Asterophora parasitica TaxID=117018 RepID=A0A9P7G766_9AGAR|nr:hypothetical protein DXG03_006928 [Asterophora parasitica]